MKEATLSFRTDFRLWMGCLLAAIGLPILLLLGCQSQVVRSPQNPTESVASSGTNNWKRLARKSMSRFAMPYYPGEALRKQFQGTVTIEIVVSAAGAVEEARVRKSSGYKVLDDAAVNLVKTRWHFPAGTRRYLLWDCTFKIDAPEQEGSTGGTNRVQNGKPSEN